MKRLNADRVCAGDEQPSGQTGERIMSFLPESYSVPQTGNYMKLVAGKNRFRVLSAAIVGNEFWKSNGDTRTPVRRRMNEPIAASELEFNARDNAPEKVKHFWAFT